MLSNLLRIKINIPPLSSNTVFRPQIINHLEDYLVANTGFTRPLTLFSAAAGFGKTTMVRVWLTGREEHVAWFSLDEADNDPQRFWIYFVYSLQTLHKSIGNSLLGVLQSQGFPAASSTGLESLLVPLLNDLFVLETPAFLVIDDYHLINNREIHDCMIFFIENLPPTLHLVITTRSDPPWPLARWRARGHMREVRINELKFSKEETHHYLSGHKKLPLDELQLDNLYRKTEGWVSGLQLAAFSLATTQDIDSFIKSFTGNHRNLLHFLSNEVLGNQQEHVQFFLMQTSILKRFCAPLCNAVTGRKDSSEIIHYLEQNNLFIITLDDLGIWFRYHHLFTDLLLYNLKAKQPDLIKRLHERAETWFLQAGEPGEAVGHALKHSSRDRVAALVHNHYAKLMQSEGPGLLLKCIENFTPAQLKQHPRLAAHKAFTRLVHKGIEDCKGYLELAEKLSYEDKKEQLEYEGLLSVVKTYYYINLQDIPLALTYADRALQLLSAENYYWKMCLAMFSGDACLFSGNPKEAYPYYQIADSNCEKLGYQYLLLNTGFKIAAALYYLGNLKEAETHTKKLLQNVKEQGLTRLTAAGTLWTLLGEMLREKGELEESEHCIKRGLLLSEQEKPPYAWNCLFDIALMYSREKYEEGLRIVRRVESLDHEYNLPFFITAPAAIWKARIYLQTGNTGEAIKVLSKIGVTERAAVVGGLERGFLTLAQILILDKSASSDEVHKLLDRVEMAATPGQQKKVLLEAQLIRAYLEDSSGNQKDAKSHLLSAVKEGKESGYFQVFIDTARQLEPVYARIMKVEQEGELQLARYVQRIYRHIYPANLDGEELQPPKADEIQDLVEDLSSRELEILELISYGLSNMEISQKLYLTLGTVKWYTNSIYGKLGVRSRTQAINQGSKLGLI